MGVVVTRGSNRISITDEFSTLSEKSTLANAAESFGKGDISLIVIQDKKDKISGIITIDRYLEVISEGMAATTMCRDIMTNTYFVTNRDSSPIEIGEKIRGKEVDAVLTQDANGRLHGFFSPNDLRDLGVDLTVPVKQIQPFDLLVDVVNIRDSFSLVPYRATLAAAAAKLHSKTIKAVLIQGKKKGIEGVVREIEFVDACASGADSDRALARDHSSDKIVRIREDTPVAEAMRIIEQHDPHAVIILGEAARFLGYVSPEDIRGIKIGVQETPPPKPDFKVISDRQQGILDELNDESEELEIPPERPPMMPPSSPRATISDVTATPRVSAEEPIKQGITKVQVDGFLDSLRSVISPDGSEDIVWSEDGSEVVVHCSSLDASIGDGSLQVTVEMSCDQCPRSAITVTFFIGKSDDLSNLYGVREQAPSGPKVLVGRWGRPFQDVVWSTMIEQGEIIAKRDESDLTGIGAGSGAIWFANSKSPMHAKSKVGGENS